jgi:hypothetical protein
MIIRKDDAPLFEQGGTRATGYASPSRGVMDTSGRAVGTRPGTQSPVHVLDRKTPSGAARGASWASAATSSVPATAWSSIPAKLRQSFSIGNPDGDPFEAVVCMPVGGSATLEDGRRLVPRWAV